MSSSTDGRASTKIRKSLLLVGPQRSELNPKDLTELRATITNTPDLVFLGGIITELEFLWPTIVEAYPKLKNVRGEESLRSLRQFLEGGEPPKLNNILLDVVTVLSQAVDFWRLATTKVQNDLFPSLSGDFSSQLQDIQGFCIGFLTAATVASSKTRADFQKHVAVALRLAVCVGAVVELDDAKLDHPHDHAASISVSWSSESEYNEFKKVLDHCQNGYVACVTDKNRVTVTILEREGTSFVRHLSSLGLSVQPIGLQGRYHYRPAHENAAHSLKELCGRDTRFQLPNAAELILPLRSNIDGDFISAGAVHEIALESILLQRCQWFQTVQAAIAHTGVEADSVVPVGPEASVPRSVTKSSLPKGKTNGITNDVSHELTNGVKLPNGISHAEQTSINDASAVAVIGMACRYPEADSLEDFWELISSGKSCVRPLPEDRFKPSEARREPKVPFWGNFLRHPDLFDHRFFGISGREAKYMDPQQRLLLQVAYEALESSGYFGLRSSSENFPSDVGCYIGVGAVDYGDNIASHDATAFSALGTLRAFISGRVSHHFGWSGPSITYDTACSSGAVAIHAAVSAIKAKECSMALAGGVNVITSPALFQNLAAASFLSPTGASKAFDASANGYCRGEGAGLVMLKPLARALADGDSVLAVITGSAVNQGANCSSITVPVPKSQSALYRRALSISGADPKEVSYVEAHGTGTPVGDPIECESIRKVFGGPHRTHELFLGSVKDNFGHTESASGAAALIKTVLMMQKRTIPKQANFTQLNPKIVPLEPDRMAVPERTQPWTAPRRIAVVNNYGAAGSNAAIVVQDINLTENDMPIVNSDAASIAVSDLPFFTSAKTPESLREYCAALKSGLPRIQESHGTKATLNLAYNLSVKQNREFGYNYTFTASNLDELASNLHRALSSDFKKLPTDRRPVVLCIGGQNGRSVHLDEDLFRNTRLLQRHLGDCEWACQALGLPSLFPTIFKPEPVADLVTLHCMLFSLQYASAKSWLDCGLNVDTIVGHSFGQLTALVVANALSLSDGLRLISERARLIQSSWGKETGIMLSIEGDSTNVERLLDWTRSRYPYFAADISCYNGPRAVVLAGDQASIDAVEEVSKFEIFSGSLKLVRLKNTHAFHSRLVDSILPGLREIAATLEFKQPSIRIEACSKDQDWSQPIDAEKIVQHSRSPVYFHDAVHRIAQRSNSCIWVEAGSASPIVSMVRRTLTVIESDSDNIFQPIDVGAPKAISKFARAACNLWAAGVKVQYWPFHQSQQDQFTWINLPPYQFQKTSHWIRYIAPTAAFPEQTQTLAKNESPPLLSSLERGPEGATFGINCTHEMFKLCIEGHAVVGQSLCPASMYIEMAIQAATLLSGSKASSTAPCLRDLKMSSPLSFSSDRKVVLQLVPVNREQDTWGFTIVSRSEPNAATSIKHATGIVSLNISDKGFQASRMQSLKRLVGQARYEHLSKIPGSNVLNGKVIYQVFGQVVDYAPYYRGVEEIVSKDNKAVGMVSVPDGQPLVMDEASCNPIMLDNFLQVAGIHVNCLSERNEDDVYICTELGELFLRDTFVAKQPEMNSWNVYSTFEQSSGKTLVNDIFVLDSKTGDLLVVFLGAVFQGIPMKSLAKSLARLKSGLNPTNSQSSMSAALNRPMETETDSSPQVTERNWPVQSNGVTPSNNSVQSGHTDVLQQVRELLSSVIEIAIEDIQPSATLTDLGIDSLMSTEILNEIKARFDVAIPVSNFLAINDVQFLAQHLASRALVTQPRAQAPQQTKAFSHCQVNGQGKDTALFGQIQEMVGDILGVSTSEITADTLLSDLGVDSLMATEVLNEIKNRFYVTIPADEFQDLRDVGALANRLRLSSSGIPTTVQLSGQPNGQLNGQSQDEASPAADPPEPFASVAHDSFLKVQRNFDVILRDTRFTDFCQSVYPAQMELVVRYVVEAFKSMGCPLATLSAGENVPDITVLSKHHKVKDQIYRILEDANIVEQDTTGKFVRTSTAVPQGQSELLHQAIVSNYPQHAFEHNLLASTGSKLADCLTGRADPLAILFGSAKARTLVENVYTHAPMFKTGTINLAQYLVHIFNKFDETRPIRILELGAGTGGTTKHLIECLAATQRKFQYTFTDISSSLVAAARKKFSQHSFMQYAVLNIEEELPVQFLNQYDIVISTNCIHATKDLTRSCTYIKNALRPNGILCLVELTRNLFWFDLVFGLLEGWWLFKDGRQHALANENLWKEHLLRSGFRWIDWTVGTSDESNIVRVITASPSDAVQVTTETVEFKRVGGVSLQADIYYPENVANGQRTLAVALMIHGGGHVMLSRKDIRPSQTRILLDAGFLPVSVDYRLCPEMTLSEGPMGDVCDALSWARTILPKLKLQRRDIRVDGDHVVAVGWSTGGHLALSLGFTAPQSGIRPPDATLAFYCPLDYEDPFWTQPNHPFGQEVAPPEGRVQLDLLEGVYDHPITAYNPPAIKRALGGWMAPSDPRSRVALHMNWKGRTLRVLLNKLSRRQALNSSGGGDPTDDLPDPTLEHIQSVSPLAQIRRGAYQVPTFIIHGTKDDLIPWEQAVRTYEALRQKDVSAEIRILEGAAHLFDLYRSYEEDENAIRAVKEGYEFLWRHVAH